MIIVKHVTPDVKLDMVVLLVGQHVGSVTLGVGVETSVHLMIRGVYLHAMYVTLVLQDVTQHVIIDMVV